MIFQFLSIRHAAGFPAGKSLVAVRIAHYNMEIHPDEIIRRFARLSVCMTPNPGGFRELKSQNFPGVHASGLTYKLSP